MGEKIVHLSPCDDMKTINSIKLNKSIPFAIVSFIYIFKNKMLKAAGDEFIFSIN